MTDQPTGRTPDEPDDVVVPDDLSSLLDGTPEPTVPDDASSLLDEAAEEPSARAGAADDDLVVPDDLSSLADGGTEEPSVALVVTQVAAAAPLAAACALARVDVDAVPSPVGAIAVLRDPASGPAGAEAISRFLRTLPVILLERREGQISAGRWTGGERVADLPPGLVLSDAPSVLEDLLLGDAAAGDLPGTVSSVGMSRWQAMRALAAGRKGR